MSLIPARAFVWLMLVPLALAILTLLDRTLIWPMLMTDGAVILLAGFDALLAIKPLVALRREFPAVFSLGRPNRVKVIVRSSARRRLRVLVTHDLFEHAKTDDLPIEVDVPARGTAHAEYFVEPRRRGAYALGDQIARYASPLGLWIRQVKTPGQSPLRVYPDLKKIRTFDLLARQNREYAFLRATRFKGGENEFERLRDYARDDEYRAIDWKATARRQKVTAREYQLESNQNVVFMLDAGRLMTAEVGGLSHFDHALNSTLMLAHVAARGGDRVGLVGFDEVVRAFVAPVGGPSAGRRLIVASYGLHPKIVEPDYDAAFEQVALRVRKRSLVILFTQVVDEVAAAAIVRRTRALLRRHLPLVVMFRDTDVERLLEQGGPGDLELYTRGAAAEIVRWREGILRDLKRAGALVLDVPATQLTGALINRYLEIKARQLL
jgi:uncharacterized protein (DUF58 family)